MPRWARHQVDGLWWIAALTLLSLTLFYTSRSSVGGLRPGSVGDYFLLIVPFLVLWLLIIVPLGWCFIKVWPKRRDLFAEYCAAQPPHPALSALSDEADNG